MRTRRNILLVSSNGTSGIDVYAGALERALVKDYPEISVIYPPTTQLGGAFFNLPLFSRTSRTAFRYGIEFLRVVNKAKRGASIVHFTNHHMGRYAVLFPRTASVITVHDIMRFWDLSGANPPYFQKPNMRDKVVLTADLWGVRNATHLITVSQSVKQELIHDLGIPEERITVVHEAADRDLFKPEGEKRIFPFPYWLYVGREYLRKNLLTLIEAFSLAKRTHPTLKLIKIGKAGGPNDSARQETLRTMELFRVDSKDVIFENQQPRQEMPPYFRGAVALVHPGYEGFGLTVVEAMACGCPVVGTNVGSVPEIMGEAGISVEHLDAARFAAAATRVMEDSNLRARLVTKGLARAAEFSWEKAARETMAVYARLL